MCMEVIRQDPAVAEPFQTLATLYDTMGKQFSDLYKCSLVLRWNTSSKLKCRIIIITLLHAYESKISFFSFWNGQYLLAFYRTNLYLDFRCSEQWCRRSYCLSGYYLFIFNFDDLAFLLFDVLAFDAASFSLNKDSLIMPITLYLLSEGQQWKHYT
jgi:hypothetical protein